MKNYCKEMNSFIFKRSWGEIFQTLPDEKAGQLIKAIYTHTNGSAVEMEDITLDSILRTITKEMDLSALKYLRRTGYLNDTGDE